MDRRWGDRTPRVAPGANGAVFVCEDVPPFGIAAFSGADVAPEELPAHFTAEVPAPMRPTAVSLGVDAPDAVVAAIRG